MKIGNAVCVAHGIIPTRVHVVSAVTEQEGNIREYILLFEMTLHINSRLNNQ